MERLGASDLGAIIEVARELGDIQDVDGFRAAVLPLLKQLVACDSASFNEVSPSTGEAVIASVDPVDSVWPDSAQLLGAYAHQNPLITAFQRSADARVLMFSDFLTHRQLHGLEIYDLVYRRIDVEHQIAFVLPAPGTRVIGFALNRKRGDFSERDRDLLRTARPFFVQAYDRAAERSLVRETVAALERAADYSTQALILIDTRGQIVLATQAATRCLSKLPAPAHRNTLPEPLASWALAQRRSTRRTSDGPRLLEPLGLQMPDGVLTARFLPGGLDRLDAIVLEGKSGALDPRELCSLGLTRRESEVLALVADGHSNAETARRLSLSEHTIAKHLEHVYAKLGVSNRTAAVARARHIPGSH